MTPTLILIRHAEAQHTSTGSYLLMYADRIVQDFSIRDSGLTEFGSSTQCSELAEYLQNNLPLAHQVELIIASPMPRALQTVDKSFGWLVKLGVPVILLAELQEIYAKPCDIGTPIDEISKEWSQYDWSQVDPLYPSKTGLYEYSKEAITKRGMTARKWLRQRPEKVIAVVGHSGFLRVGMSYRKYCNADFRIFDFDEGDDAVGGKLVEWEMTENKGGGLGKSPNGIAGWESIKSSNQADLDKEGVTEDVLLSKPVE
ncbi:histidine phosphatase superfamily [Halenospora varia]|nr:histidine phosphatase superfamily [Halenospora varia]